MMNVWEMIEWQQYLRALILTQMAHADLEKFQWREIDITSEEDVQDEQKGAEDFQLPEIDITSELTRVSSEGLTSLERATLAVDGLALQLATVKHTFEYVLNTMQLVQHATPAAPSADGNAEARDNDEDANPVAELMEQQGSASNALIQSHNDDPGSDDLELLAARGMQEISELLRQQRDQEAPPLPKVVVKGLKVVQRHVQDVVLLVCSKGVPPEILQRSKGVPPELLKRLEAAFGTAALQDDELWSRLGNAKYHVWTHGMRFGERKHRHGRGGRKSRRSWLGNTADDEEAADDEDRTVGSSSVEIPNANKALDEPTQIHLPEDRPVPKTSAPPPPAPVPKTPKLCEAYLKCGNYVEAGQGAWCKGCIDQIDVQRARGALKAKMQSTPSANEPMKIHLSEDRKVGPIPISNKALDDPDEPMKIHLGASA